MENNSRKIAEYLLQINAIKLQPSNPFTWASGWKSPIYCDNRKTLSFPEIRSYIRDSFTVLINKYYPDAEMIAGVATGAVPHAALVADRLEMPFIYVRSGAKDHGLGNQIEDFTGKDRKWLLLKILYQRGRAVSVQ
jgi:orotate phosphoribosyltransferase